MDDCSFSDSEIKIEQDELQDEECDSKTVQSKFLKKHRIRHKLPEHRPPTDHSDKSWKEYLRLESSLQTYYCSHCTFETKWKCYLKNHINKIHTPPEETRMYHCMKCKFQTKWKFSLSNHMKVHSAPGTVRMHKCPHCSYQTKWNNGLTSHMKVHVLPKVVKLTVYKCEKCSFECKNKLDLGHHVKMCHDPVETVYKCPLCSFETKNRHGVNKHVKVHNAAKINGVK